MIFRTARWLVATMGVLSIGCVGLFPSVPADYTVDLNAPMPVERLQTVRAEIAKINALRPFILEDGGEPSCWYYAARVRSALVEGGVDASITGCQIDKNTTMASLLIHISARARNDPIVQTEVDQLADRIERVLRKYVGADEVERRAKWYGYDF